MAAKVCGQFPLCKKLKKIAYRGSYMSAHVLLNLLNELGKSDKMRGFPSILSPFRNEFNKFNNTSSMNVRFNLSYDKYFEI